MAYVDGFVLPVAKDKLEAYRALAEGAGKIWIEHGALEYKECVLDDGAIPGVRPFAEAAGAGEGETVIFAYITYHSREHRDEVNQKVMADPRIQCHDPSTMPFDCARMAYSGFKAIVEYKNS